MSTSTKREVAQLRKDNKRYVRILRMDKPYPIFGTMEILEKAAVHLLDHHSCDCGGPDLTHEGIRHAVNASKEIRAAAAKL